MISYFIISFTCGWCLYWILYSGSFGSNEESSGEQCYDNHPKPTSFLNFLDDDEEEEDMSLLLPRTIRKAVFVSQLNVRAYFPSLRKN